MLNKMFEAIARKQLKENAFDRLRGKQMYRLADKIGAVVKYSDGSEGIDMLKMKTHNLKTQVFMCGIVIPAAAIIGNVCGNIRVKR